MEVELVKKKNNKTDLFVFKTCFLIVLYVIKKNVYGPLLSLYNNNTLFL